MATLPILPPTLRYLPLLFAVTLFMSATLVFSVQPLVAKIVLPLLGGTPAVWNTCLVFFQAVLLAGYAYAHLHSSRLGRGRFLLHLGLLAAALAFLPIAISPPGVERLPRESNPVSWLIGVLTVSAGLPFFAVCTTAPLLQKWFSGTKHPAAADPYFLYAASNAGSILGLLLYPSVIEPSLSLAAQSRLWQAGFGILLVLTVVCALAAWRTGAGQHASSTARARKSPVGPRRRLGWLLRSFVPSSLLLGVTTYVSTDIAAIPLLWVVPLALYLLAFILVFAKRPFVPGYWTSKVLAILVLLVTIQLLSEMTMEVALAPVGLHLGAFFVACLVCLGGLAADRPPADRLTEYYLWMALGGAAGGTLNALLAPMIFEGVVEYPLALVLALVLRSENRAAVTAEAVTVRKVAPVPFERLDWLLPIVLGGLTAVLVLLVDRFASMARPEDEALKIGVIFGVPSVVCYTLVDRPLRFALGVAAIMLAGQLHAGVYGRVEHRERNFFGVLRVTRDAEGKFRQLIHGQTLHGRQSLDPLERAQPLSYYHGTGPIGQVFATYREKFAGGEIAVIGLGAGSLAANARPGQGWTFYEIDPAVERLARDPAYFTFLGDSRARALRVVLGDARLRLREAPDGAYRLMVLDAFSSDAIPVHLLTREALSLYLSKLESDGLLCVHISNKFFDLRPVLAALAAEAGAQIRYRRDLEISPREKAVGKDPSEWVVLARNHVNLAALAGWTAIAAPRGAPLWTDDFSNLVGVIRRER